jgi:uncharacterized RDD family membrane protein YckC/Tfp pilus assembly protein PilE
MNGPAWFYLDLNREKHGPVNSDFILAELKGGKISNTTMVWRDGLPDWVPVSQVLNELGISGPPPPPPYSGTRLDTRTEDVVYAGFFRRWAALFLDQLIITIPLLVALILLAVAFGLFGTDHNSETGFAVLQSLYYLLYLITAGLYYAGLESSKHQATFGKRALGIKVTDDAGNRISFTNALGRWAAASLSYLTCYIGFLMAAFTERKRALHDMVAGTLVVDRWAYSEHPERQQRGNSGCVIAFIIGAVLFIPMIAILAAIAISQYQDYVVRSQVTEGTYLADGVKTAVAEYIQNNKRFPTSNADAGLPAPSSISGSYVSQVDVGSEPGKIEVTYSSHAPQHANATIDNQVLVYSAVIQGDEIKWVCNSSAGTTILNKHRPTICRD